MIRSIPFALLGIALSASPSAAQGDAWRPPSREMPVMPASAELAGDWLGPRSAWFAGLPARDLRASGEPRGAASARVARFHNGALPIVVWADRNGDARADMIEIYRAGGVIVQLIDADYDGNANVLRRYDASGALLSEERM